MKDVTILALALGYRLAIILLCGYVVFVMHASGWWFCMALLLCSVRVKTGSDDASLER